MLPYSITCTTACDNLFELDDGRLQLISGGDTAPLMIGSNYILAELRFIEILEELNVERISNDDAVILRRRTGEEYRTHRRLKIGQCFQSEMINDLNVDGNRLLLMDNTYLFCSPLLKSSLEKYRLSYLSFTEGLSNFG